jgi:heat shock protein HslJ
LALFFQADGGSMRLSTLTVIVACLLAATAAEAQSLHGRHQKPDAPAAPAPATQEKNFPLNNTWILQSINGKPVVGEPPTFQLDSTLRASGFSGCNTFSMILYPIKDQKLAGGAIALTHRTCDKDVMLAEHNFLVGLHSLPKWDSTPNGDLVITGATGAMLFRRGI